MEEFRDQYNENNKELVGRYVFNTYGSGSYSRGKRLLVITKVLKSGFKATSDGDYTVQFNWRGGEKGTSGVYSSKCVLLTDEEVTNIRTASDNAKRLKKVKEEIINVVSNAKNLDYLEVMLALLKDELSK